MKHFIIPFFAFLLLISCKSDDDATLAEDSIVGKWQLEAIDAGDSSVDLQVCEDLETYFFNPDFSFRAERFKFNLIVEECVLNAFVEGAWGTSNEGTYFTNTTGTQNNFATSFSEEETLLQITISDPLSGLQEIRSYRKQ